MMSKSHVLLTGFPGVGKTTLIKKIITQLKDNNMDLAGFYTEEVRNESHNRIGFDVVTLDGKRGKLARTLDHVPPNSVTTSFKVGQYVVFPDEFEKLVVPLFRTKEKILVLDEIGKMELFSDTFKKLVEDAFKSTSKLIVATIPVSKGRPIPLVDALRNDPKCYLITVERGNRNKLLEEIVEKITRCN